MSADRALFTGGQYRASPTTLTDGATQGLTLDQRGALRVVLSDGNGTALAQANQNTSDAVVTTTSALRTSALGYLYDAGGNQFTRQRQVAAGLNSTGVGIAASGLVAQLDDTTPTAITEDQFGAVRMSSDRGLLTAVVDGSGVTRARKGDALGYASANTTIIQNALTKYGVLKIDPLGVPFEFADYLGAPSGGGLVGFGWASWLQAVNSYGKRHGVGNATVTPADAAHMDYGVVFMGFRLSMNGANNALANASSGESCGVALRACNDAHVERLYVEDAKGDNIYCGAQQGGSTLAPSGVRILNCKSYRAYRNGFGVTEGIDGVATGNSAIGFRLHGFDFEPNSSSSVIRNWKGSIFATCNPDGSWGGDSSGNTGGLCVTEGNLGQVSDIEFDVQAYYLNGCGVVVKGVDGFDIRIRSRGCTSHGFYAGVLASKGSVGIVRGYINVPAGAGNGLISRTAGDEISSHGLKIVQAANNQAVAQSLATAGTHVGLRAKCTAANPQSGIQLSGCSNVVVVAPDFDGFSHSVSFSMQSTTPTTGCQILGGRLANATQSDNVLESGSSDNNLVDGCTVVGAHPAITLVGPNSKKRNIVGSGAAVVFEDVKTASVTLNAPSSVPGLALASATVSFTGAKVTDQFEVPPPAALPSGYGPPVAWCPSADTVQIAYPQWAGTAAAPPGMSGNHNVKLKRLG